MTAQELDRLALLFASEAARGVVALTVLHLPGFRQAPVMARIGLGVFLALACVTAKWESPEAVVTGDNFFSVALRNLFAGLVVALIWNLVLEACALAVQLASVQSGLSYASIIDPTNETESGSLLSIVQFCLLVTFLGAGIHLEFLAALLEADRLWEKFESGWQGVSMLKSTLAYSFRTGFRLAVPYVASMLLFDLASALAGRFAERFQISMLVFPLKWGATLLLVWASTATLHRLEVDLAADALGLIQGGAQP